MSIILVMVLIMEDSYGKIIFVDANELIITCLKTILFEEIIYDNRKIIYRSYIILLFIQRYKFISKKQIIIINIMDIQSFIFKYIITLNYKLFKHQGCPSLSSTKDNLLRDILYIINVLSVCILL